MSRIVFMGTPDFAVPPLLSLIDSGQLVGVVTQPDRPAGRGRKLVPPPVKTAAEKAGIPVFQPESLRRPDAAAPLRDWQPDLIIVAAFGQILRPHVLELPRLGCVNIHASLLPRWRGAAPIQYAILSGDEETGITLMQMDKGLDTGPMLVRESLPIDPRETAATLHDKLARLGGEMMTTYLDDLLHSRLAAVPQDDTNSTYAGLIKKEDGRLDWSQPAVDLDRRIRAMTPWPAAFSFWGEDQIKILDAHPLPDESNNHPPGTLFSLADGLAIRCGQGALRLNKIQLQGKKALLVEDFLRGRPDFVGSRLD